MAEEFSPKLIGFACSSAPMSALNLAGLKGRAYPPNVRFIRVNCSGRMDPADLLKLLEGGTDGVLVLGCAPGHCSHHEGSDHMEARVGRLRSLLGLMGWPATRVESLRLAPGDDEKLVEFVTSWTGEMRRLGPNPRRRDALDGD